MPTAGDLAALLGGARAARHHRPRGHQRLDGPVRDARGDEERPVGRGSREHGRPRHVRPSGQGHDARISPVGRLRAQPPARGARRAGQHQGRPALVEPDPGPGPELRHRAGQLARALRRAAALDRPAAAHAADGARAGRGDRGVGRKALLVTATARGDNAIAGEIAPLGWSADRWELVVDAERGILLATTAFVGEKPFRKVEATSIELDQPFDDALFAPPSGV